MDPNQTEGTGISRKIGPLPLWGWGVGLVVVVVGWYYFRGGGSSSAVDNSQGGFTTGDVNSGDYSSGYDSGYAAGLNANGGTTTQPGDPAPVSQGDAQGPIAHNRFKAKTKDPSGRTQTVTGYGTWIKKGGKWVWQVGIPKQFALPGNGTGTGASAAAPDVAAAGVAPAATADAAPVQAAAATSPASAATIDQATGTSTVGSSGGGATGVTRSGSSGGSAPAQSTSNANRIAQIVKDLQNPGPNFTRAQQTQYLASYQNLVGHAYTGKLGQLQVGQHVAYATV